MTSATRHHPIRSARLARARHDINLFVKICFPGNQPHPWQQDLLQLVMDKKARAFLVTKHGSGEQARWRSRLTLNHRGMAGKNKRQRGSNG
jgi:hypothetical protein